MTVLDKQIPLVYGQQMDNPVYIFLAIAVFLGAVSLKLTKVAWWMVSLFALAAAGLGWWGVDQTPGAAIIGGAAGAASPYLISFIFGLIKTKLGSLFEVKVVDQVEQDKADKPESTEVK